MKKPYIVPESRVFSINLNENIAASDKVTQGDDIVTAQGVIRFTFGTEPCRGKYTDFIPVTVGDNATYSQYMADLREGATKYGIDGYMAFFNCSGYESQT